MAQGTVKGKWRWAGKLALWVLGLAVVGLVVSAILFSRWSEIREVSAEEAEQAFADVLADLGHPPAYLEVSPAGTVSVRRELEREDPVALVALHLLAWDPEDGRILDVVFPFWFVRLKMTDTINLGTLVSALAGDWKGLALSVTEEDLERLGPGLVLDQTTVDGARLLIWNQGK